MADQKDFIKLFYDDLLLGRFPLIGERGTPEEFIKRNMFTEISLVKIDGKDHFYAGPVYDYT